MISLIAESKTMAAEQKEVSTPLFESHKPIFEDTADELAESFASMPVEEIAERLSVSLPLASKASQLFYDFPNKSVGFDALHGFTGEVFKALQVSTLSQEALDFSEEHLMIISSLYGPLSPDSIIKPYRFDFSVENPSTGYQMSKFWKQRMTISFVNHIKEAGIREVVDLLPGEASKCLDWKLIKAFTKVVKVDFKTMGADGNLRTPHTGKLKEMRGKLLRHILEESIDSFNCLKTVASDEFSPLPDLHKPGLLVFIC